MPFGDPPASPDSEAVEPPPFLKTWARVYSAVLIYLALLLVTLYSLTRAFRY